MWYGKSLAIWEGFTRRFPREPTYWEGFARDIVFDYWKVEAGKVFGGRGETGG